MNTTYLYNQICELKNNDIEQDTYMLFNYQNIPYIYYGINASKNIVFVVDSTNSDLQSMKRITKELSLVFNARCSIILNNQFLHKKVHLIVCKSENYFDKIAFLRLSQTFIDCIRESEDTGIISDFFIALTNLFSKTSIPTKRELQGFFTELYLIDYLSNEGIDIIKYWQKQDKMKFDFMIDQTKRLEVKSTTKEFRIHHFKHSQLLTNCYDIIIASFLVRETNKYSGLSLENLIERLYSKNIVNHSSNMYITNFIKNIPEDYIKNIHYDEIYLKNNLKFYNANIIPRYLGDEPQGVSKTEYNSDLSYIQDIETPQIFKWIES